MNKLLTVVLAISPMHLIASENINIDEKLKDMLTCQDWAANYYLDHTVDHALLTGGGLTETINVIDEIITVDTTTLKNSLPHEQELPVPGFTYSHSQTKSTTNNTGWTFNYGLNVNASFNVMFMSGGVSHTLGLQYDMSSSNTKTESVTKTWDSPSFFVSVPANRTYRIDYQFHKANISGYSKIDAELYGVEKRWSQRPSPTQVYTRSLYESLDIKNSGCKKGFIGVNHEDYGLGISYSGRARFNAVQGMKVFVEIRDITDLTRNSNGTLIERRFAVLATKE